MSYENESYGSLAFETWLINKLRDLFEASEMYEQRVEEARKWQKQSREAQLEEQRARTAAIEETSRWKAKVVAVEAEKAEMMVMNQNLRSEILQYREQLGLLDHVDDDD